MSRRSSPQSRIDDLAFPVRVKVVVPTEGFGRRLDHLHRWLKENLGFGEYAVHPAATFGGNATACYFKTTDGSGPDGLRFAS